MVSFIAANRMWASASRVRRARKAAPSARSRCSSRSASRQLLCRQRPQHQLRRLQQRCQSHRPARCAARTIPTHSGSACVLMARPSTVALAFPASNGCPIPTIPMMPRTRLRRRRSRCFQKKASTSSDLMSKPKRLRMRLRSIPRHHQVPRPGNGSPTSAPSSIRNKPAIVSPRAAMPCASRSTRPSPANVRPGRQRNRT